MNGPNPFAVIPTGTTDSFIVRCGVEVPHISLLLLSVFLRWAHQC
jgi:hypothetical protein